MNAVANPHLAGPPADLTILMYHGIRRVGAPVEAASDPVYELMQGPFSRQLDHVAASGAAITTLATLAQADDPTPREGRAVVLSFDDGIQSHADTVVPMLLDQRRGFSGEFFVSADLVGKPGFISWAGLRDMDRVGMSIQSHGCRHRYLTDLGEREAVEEMNRSRHLIEDKIGKPVTVFAAPGGRINSRLATHAYRLGYHYVCGSQPGYWRPDRATAILPRMAVRHATPDAVVKAWISGSRTAVLKTAVRYRALHMARSMLGNGLYDRVRDRYLNAGSTGAAIRERRSAP